MIKLILVFVLFCSCSNHTEQKEKINKAIQTNHISDTIIGRKNITNEIAGSEYRKRAKGYFVIVKNDTSGFMPIFTESRDNLNIGIDLNLHYSKTNETYSQQLNELKLILQNASKEFNLDSLKGISIGRLILTGDLAIDITKQYKKKFGDNELIKTEDYQRISDFLLESKLTKDINELLKPYLVSVEKISIEKVFFTTKNEILNYCSLEKDTARIPDRILDCMTWIRIKNE